MNLGRRFLVAVVVRLAAAQVMRASRLGEDISSEHERDALRVHETKTKLSDFLEENRIQI